MKYPVFLYKKVDVYRTITFGSRSWEIKDRTETKFLDSFYNFYELTKYISNHITTYNEINFAINGGYHVIDYSGKIYPYEQIYNQIIKKSKKIKKEYIHRNGPVPNKTNRYLNWYKTHYRSPKTYNEFSHNINFDSLQEEFKIKGRKRKLPTFWDEVTRKSFYNKNWKRFRKTQYKC